MSWFVLSCLFQSRGWRALLDSSSGYLFFARWGTNFSLFPWPRFGGCILPGVQRNSLSKRLIGWGAHIWAMPGFPEKFGQCCWSKTQEHTVQFLDHGISSVPSKSKDHNRLMRKLKKEAKIKKRPSEPSDRGSHRKKKKLSKTNPVKIEPIVVHRKRKK